MIYIVLNAVPITIAMLVSLVIGKIWLRVINRPRPSYRVIALIAAAQFWMAGILAGALILAPPEAGVWTMALGSAVIIWIGFVVPTLVTSLIIGRVSARMIASVCAYWLTAIIAQAAVMQGYGLTPPPA